MVRRQVRAAGERRGGRVLALLALLAAALLAAGFWRPHPAAVLQADGSLHRDSYASAGGTLLGSATSQVGQAEQGLLPRLADLVGLETEAPRFLGSTPDGAGLTAAAQAALERLRTWGADHPQALDYVDKLQVILDSQYTSAAQQDGPRPTTNSSPGDPSEIAFDPAEDSEWDNIQARRHRHEALLAAKDATAAAATPRMVDAALAAGAQLTRRARQIYAGFPDEASIDVSDMPPDWLSRDPGSDEATTNQFAPQEWQKLIWRSLKIAQATVYEPGDVTPYYTANEAHMAALPDELRRRCAGTVGDWCGKFYQQQTIPPKAPPHGNLKCPDDCNGVGVCHADHGYCLCPAGWTGPGCTVRQLRPCSHKVREKGWRPRSQAGVPLSAGGWMAGRCGGVCDDEIAACYCNGTHGRIPAPEGSPPGTPPIQMGRPLNDECKPMYGEDGKKNDWGNYENGLFFDVWDGWCEADKPDFKCPCYIDGLGGEFCDTRYEMTCANQCNGHGECNLGFCKCHSGWYGADCALRVEGQPNEPDGFGVGAGLQHTERPWLAANIKAPAAEDPPTVQQRKRPLIYVYDLAADYNTRMLQYRVDAGPACFYRKFDAHTNDTLTQHTLYMVESAFHEMFLQSEHRTFDPEEADYFYVPVYSSCLMWPVFGWADHPWWYGVAGPRVMHGTHILLEAKWWLERHYPKYWRRRRGRDHIWLMPFDEGPCWAPTEIWPGVILGHWGRRDFPHASGTAYGADNYTEAYNPSYRGWAPHDWRRLHSNHPCFDPRKDLVLPCMETPHQLRFSPLLGAPPQRRDVLLFLRGDVGQARLPHYSRGVRQKLYKLSRERGWREAHNVVIDSWSDDKTPYGLLLARSKFCVAAAGDGFARRAEDAILHGCIPVVIMDDVDEKFSTVVDWSAFSVRVAEADVERVVDILLAITPGRLLEMQRNLGTIWNRFRYANIPLYWEKTKAVVAANLANATDTDGPPLSEPDVFRGDPQQDDAWATIMEWLYARIPDTR